MMQDHLDRIRRETAAVREQVDRARRVLEGLGSLTVPEVPRPVVEVDKKEAEKGLNWEEKTRERDAEIWKATDALLA